jgi:putative DNA primase/helicase
LNIEPKHLQEWTEDSGVSEAIALLNLESLSDSQEIDKLLNRNTDRRWQHWSHGPGWAVKGIDPESEELTLLGAQFKLDAPVPEGFRRDGTPKVRKYFSLLYPI